MSELKKRWNKIQFGGDEDEPCDADEFLRFEEVKPKLSNRADLHAFMRLDQWIPSDNEDDLICSAGHDEIWLSINEEQIASLTDEQILELIRCGVFLDGDTDSLTMFV